MVAISSPGGCPSRPTWTTRAIYYPPSSPGHHAASQTISPSCGAARRTLSALAAMAPGSDYLNSLNYYNEPAAQFDPRGSNGWDSHYEEDTPPAYYATI